MKLSWIYDSGITEILKFGADGVQGTVGGCFVCHVGELFEDYLRGIDVIVWDIVSGEDRNARSMWSSSK